MSDLKQYLKHVERSGHEMVLETAARDSELSDADYVDLWEAIYSTKTWSARSGKSHAMKMRDRDFARTSNG
jgi:hypothetical protein